MAQPQRIAYIDFMKCLCIMLIVMYHIDHEFFNYLASNLNNALQAFRLPMYYFISGIFFKLYGGFADFTRRKVNNILVPFVFFVVLAYGLRLVEFGARYLIGAQPIDINPSILIEPFYMRSWLLTSPLWFLLSLFWVNIIFYALQRLIKPLWGLLLATVDDMERIRHDRSVSEQVFRRIALILRRNFRSVDFICRIDFDEFAVIMTRVDSSLERLVRDKVRRINQMLMEQEDLPTTTLSVGVAFSDRRNPEGDIFYDADSALHKLRASGTATTPVFGSMVQKG